MDPEGNSPKKGEHDHAAGEGAPDIRSKLADMLGKARTEDQEREKACMREREQDLGDERKWQRDSDRGLGWELWSAL